MSQRSVLLVLLAGVFTGLVEAAENQEVISVNIGYAEIIDDPRYEEKRAYARIRVKPHHRPLAGAEVAIRESRVLGRALKKKFGLSRIVADNAGDMANQIRLMKESSGVRFFIVDADAAVLTAVSEAIRDLEVLLFNVSEYSDQLRGNVCKRELMHVIPSYAMLADALSQFILSRKWRDVLLLKGPEIPDRAFAEAFKRSARRFGLKIEEELEFLPGNDPREREQNNISLMTAGSDADLIFVSDIEGEFGRYVQYKTQAPLLVVGTEGLQAAAWHWTWERHGAPQLNQRFERQIGRRMQASDWAAWAAVKAIIESISRTRSTEFGEIQQYLRSQGLNLDAYKGAPVSFRSWDNQLRQPLLLHTYNAVIERAPFSGFLHPTENMDSLGYDKGDRLCRF